MAEQITYIETFSGNKLDLSKSVEEIAQQIDIQDIATGLSNMVRYSGQTQRPYNVAEHSVHVASLVKSDPEAQLMALLHDASEAYLADIPSPFKAMCPDYKALENKLEQAIRIHFGFSDEAYRENWKEIKHADFLCMVAEVNNMGFKTIGEWVPEDFQKAYEARGDLKSIPQFVSPFVARGAFLKLFTLLKAGQPIDGVFEKAADFARIQLA